MFFMLASVQHINVSKSFCTNLPDNDSIKLPYLCLILAVIITNSYEKGGFWQNPRLDCSK